MKQSIIALLLIGIMTVSSCSSATTKSSTETSSINNQLGTANDMKEAIEITQEKELLIVGMEANYAPYNWNQPTDSNGAVKIDGGAGYAGGFDVEVAKELARVLDRELVIKQISWEGLIPAVQNGAIDLIIAGMSETPERAESVDFSIPYYDSAYVMLVKKGSPYEQATSLNDFSMAKVVGQKGTNYDRAISQIPGVRHETPLGTVPLIIHAIANEVVDGTVLDKPVGISVVHTNPNLVMVEFPPEQGFQQIQGVPTACSIALAKGNSELKAEIDAYLAMFDEEKRDSLMELSVKNQP